VTVWLSRQLILAIHDEQLAGHGGALGLRDAGLLDSALARPLNRAGYGEPDTAELAAPYAVAIARDHPLVDGNKRTAYAALETFLAPNGRRFPVGDAEAVVMTLAMALGEIADEEFTTWVRGNVVVVGGSTSRTEH
jgi:death-on-curing protein